MTQGIYSYLISFSLVSITYIWIYTRRRYRSKSLALAPLAPTPHFVTKYFGLVPPPSTSEKTDEISKFLIRAGQDSKYSPVSVCWSITGKPLVVVSTLKGIKDVLITGQHKSKNEIPKVQRGDLIRLIHNLVFGGKNLNNTIGEEWRWRRHVLLPPFQPKQLVPKLLPYVTRRVNDLMELFAKHAEEGSAAELDSYFMDTTMDVINYYLYGRHDLNYDLVGGRTNLKFIHGHLGFGFQSLKAWLPFGINKTDWGQKSYKPAREQLKTFIRDSLKYALQDYHYDLKKFKERGIPPKDHIYRSVAACAFASGRYGEDHVDLVNDLLALTFAGYDTTAHTLAFTFAELAQNPQLQEDLFNQVRQVLGPPPIDPDTITTEKLARMPLVTAVYKEALRKYPAVVFIPVHVNRDILVDGVVVPGDSEIWCNVRGVQMNPRIFPDPDKFDPTRWLRPEHEESEDHSFDTFKPPSTSVDLITPSNQYDFPDIAFTLGQHSCLGKNLATLELRLIIASTVNQFTFHLKEGCHIDTKVVLTTKPRHGVWTYFKKRVNDAVQ
ncbi:cytochrome P450 [Rhizopus microsporus var. microsporus]|uniref:Cytochrome P450 n=1 Tax=Rhizopus microsporus var. microsporus TaxID=86635 RepID=A0A1X0RJA1_RHIZD|nr:cytochrome P450 [Rhizopus microsporus var. microsporus]